MKWSNLKPIALAVELAQRGYDVYRKTAAELLEVAGFKKRKLRKELITGEVDPVERNEQFEHIAALRESYYERGLPVFGVNTKKGQI